MGRDAPLLGTARRMSFNVTIYCAYPGCASAVTGGKRDYLATSNDFAQAHALATGWTAPSSKKGQRGWRCADHLPQRQRSRGSPAG